jgi:hypothetical protein
MGVAGRLVTPDAISGDELAIPMDRGELMLSSFRYLGL